MSALFDKAELLDTNQDFAEDELNQNAVTLDKIPLDKELLSAKKRLELMIEARRLKAELDDLLDF